MAVEDSRDVVELSVRSILPAVVGSKRSGGHKVQGTFFRRAAWGVAFAVPLAAVLGWALFRQPHVAQRVYRIGWQNSPPYQIDDEGTPSGLAVDLVREAARRRGIDLRWIHWQNSSESAIGSKAVDLWPLMTILPERLKFLHISEPYMDVEYSLIVRRESPYREAKDLATASIGVANFSLESRLLPRFLPNARMRTDRSTSKLLEDVCQQRDEAAFMDVFTAISTLLDESACSGHPLRWIAVPGMQQQLGIGATFEAGAVADVLRSEIGDMAAEGKLAPVVNKRGLIPRQNLESMEGLVGARRRETRLVAVAVLFALLLALACLQAIRITRQRNRVRHAELALRGAEQHLTEANTALATELRERTRSEQEIHALTARLINAQEEERSRLARELHDDLSQQIAAVSLAASNLKKRLPPESVEAIAQSGRLQQNLIHLAECVRRLSHELHPLVLQHSGLAAALRNYCREIAALTSHRIVFQSGGSYDGVPPAVALCVYRVAQEAIQNSIKHAHADEAEVVLTRGDGLLRLTVSDKGAGI